QGALRPGDDVHRLRPGDRHRDRAAVGAREEVTLSALPQHRHVTRPQVASPTRVAGSLPHPGWGNWVLARAREHLGSRAVEISRVGVVGLGTMGAGIAQVCLQAGVEVIGREVEPELGERAHRTIDHYLTRGVEKGRLSQEEKEAALERLCLVTELGELASCGLVIEAAFEDLDVKRELFAELDRIVAPPAILATNTSALSVTQIAEATQTSERVVGMHFFNPAPVLPLVEVIRTPHTGD